MRIFDLMLNILFPPRCTYCKAEGAFLCTGCINQLSIYNLQFSKRKTKDLNKEFQYLDGVIYGMDYSQNPGIKAALKQFKYKFTQDLADYFGQVLSEKLSELGMCKNKKSVLIPVPLHRKRLNYRGFNQAELIAKAINPNLISHLLKRVKNTSQQAKLSKEERQINLDNAFEVCDLSIDPNSIYFIVDDVCTTGSTLENCAKALKEAGMKKVYGLVVARAFK
ncbi:hypothetical protein KKA95_04330 [Patescibacteria group bacterium]|nr:hypothetical protein [Patescibacteria group bacterium]